MANQIKQGAKGQKIGRNKRRPSHSSREFRAAANRERRIKRAEAVRQFHKAHPRVHVKGSRFARRAENFTLSIEA